MVSIGHYGYAFYFLLSYFSKLDIVLQFFDKPNLLAEIPRKEQ